MDFNAYWPSWPDGKSSTLVLVDTNSTTVDELFRLLFGTASTFQACPPTPPARCSLPALRNTRPRDHDNELRRIVPKMYTRYVYDKFCSPAIACAVLAVLRSTVVFVGQRPRNPRVYKLQ